MLLVSLSAMQRGVVEIGALSWGSEPAGACRLLAVVPDTVAGRRDRALLLVLVLTGRRRAEVIDLRAGDLSLNDETVLYSYRGKGGKRGRRELPRPAHAAILRTLADAGQDLATMDPGESLWQAAAGPRGITSGTFYGPRSFSLNCRWRFTCVASPAPSSAARSSCQSFSRTSRRQPAGLSAVTLEGEPGIGKTRLLLAAAEMAWSPSSNCRIIGT